MATTAAPGVVRPVRVLIINPNATASMTQNCVATTRANLPPHIAVEGFTASPPAPSAVEGFVDNVLSSAAAMRELKPLAPSYDAFLVACYSDHALVRMLREELDQPCMGIMEASLYAARVVGGRFAILATSARSRYLHEDAVRNYGLEHFCAGVGACAIGVLELDERPGAVVDVMARKATELVRDKGADCILLGCAGMTGLRAAVQEAVGEDVQVVDGVLTGVYHLAGLVMSGLKTAKAGVYTSSAAYREKRGQTYL